MKRVFVDENTQATFEREGFVIVPFYNSSEVSQLLDLYRTLHPKDEKGFFPSTFSKDKNYRKIADEEVRKIGARSIEKLLQDVKIVCGSFIVKAPKTEQIMDIHQDMTLVDESEFTGINIWCPLIDLTDENGMLYALPKSHRIFPTYRGASVPTIYENVAEKAMQLSTPIRLRAGEAIVFDQSILHWSEPNTTNDVRPVTNIYFTHKDARFRTCYYNKTKEPNGIEVFAQDDSFMTDFEQFGDNIFERPKIGKSLGFFDYDFPKLTKEKLENLYGENEKKSFFNRIKSLFV